MAKVSTRADGKPAVRLGVMQHASLWWSQPVLLTSRWEHGSLPGSEGEALWDGVSRRARGTALFLVLPITARGEVILASPGLVRLCQNQKGIMGLSTTRHCQFFLPFLLCFFLPDVTRVLACDPESWRIPAVVRIGSNGGLGCQVSVTAQVWRWCLHLAIILIQ